MFMELFFVNFFLLLRKKSKKINSLFARTAENPDLMKGLLWFLKKKVVKTDLAGGDKENKKVRDAAKEAVGFLKGLVTAQTIGKG
jgi:nucleolar MIF4G domain-containing protein 1